MSGLPPRKETSRRAVHSLERVDIEPDKEAGGYALLKTYGKRIIPTIVFEDDGGITYRRIWNSRPVRPRHRRLV